VLVTVLVAIVAAMVFLMVMFEGVTWADIVLMPGVCPRCFQPPVDPDAHDPDHPGEFRAARWYSEGPRGHYRCRRCGARFKEWPNGTIGPDT